MTRPGQHVTVGQLLRAARTARGWTQADLAARVHRHQMSISYWETGQRASTVDDLITVAWALGVTPAELLPTARLTR